ncbi:rho GTPase-activating protein 24 [Corythoichthys intestinalis]|uniref:rho GTPase-activating protein 24 n=1 Tax=Corythoichthys intestinalis TaxID=161448 RepID=UPI0025A60144|nr:rho GTPase-activating protein 24 [Corythoichthys intestinalis]XP_061801571.1 rho GTPase-activating protein 24-like [Nerophis lumbriciformis]
MGLSCFKSWKHDRAGLKGNRDVLASPGSYFFLSNSAGQGDEWLKSLNKGVWIPFTGVFGQRLEETVLYERRYGISSVPLVVEQCVAFIRERGLQEVGLFRQPGRASLVKELQEAFDAGERPSFDSNTDVHTVASLLKLYLRQLPEPLVPFSHYEDFLLSGQMLLSDRMQGLEELSNLLQELPVANFNLLKFICQFLNEVQSHSKGNKMSCNNLATVFGPNILRAKTEDPQSIMGGAGLVQALMLEMIREHQSLFSRVLVPVPAHTTAGFYASPAALRRPHLHQCPCPRQMSLPLIAERCREPAQSTSSVSPAAATSGHKTLLGHRYTSSHPETCFFPLLSPSKNHYEGRTREQCQQLISGGSPPADVHSSKEPKSEHMSWMEVWNSLGEPRDTVGKALADEPLWIPGATQMAVAEGDCTKGTDTNVPSRSSSGTQEDSTPSDYDNLDSAHSSQIMEDVASEHLDPKEERDSGEESEEAWQTVDDSSSWSSCEVLPLLKSGSQVSLDVTPKRSPSSQAAEDDKRLDGDAESDHNEGRHLNTPTSGSILSPLSTGSSEVFLPSGPPELSGPENQSQPDDAQLLLAELRQQMAQQRTEYQARIHRLVRCNDALERQVAALRDSLERQRRSQSAAEVRIRDVERARAAADCHNSTLQADMELFFQTNRKIRTQEWKDDNVDDADKGGKTERTLKSL